jgi:hypothetical protein
MNATTTKYSYNVNSLTLTPYTGHECASSIRNEPCGTLKLNLMNKRFANIDKRDVDGKLAHCFVSHSSADGACKI